MHICVRLVESGGTARVRQTAEQPRFAPGLFCVLSFATRQRLDRMSASSASLTVLAVHGSRRHRRMRPRITHVRVSSSRRTLFRCRRASGSCRATMSAALVPVRCRSAATGAGEPGTTLKYTNPTRRAVVEHEEVLLSLFVPSLISEQSTKTELDQSSHLCHRDEDVHLDVERVASIESPGV